MSQRNFQLERFYYGVLASDKQAKPTVLARSPNLTPDHLAECLAVGRITPPSADQTSEEMTSAVGLFRGEKVDFILAVAQLTALGTPQLMYIGLPNAPVQWLGGNLGPFKALGYSQMPVFEQHREVTPFALNDPQPMSAEEQSDAMLDLLLYCQDNMKIVEGLLTSLIQGKNLGILNAPLSLEKRLRFVEALNCLLPLPARIAMTFATHVGKSDTSVAQVKFLSGDTAPDEHIVYDWASGKITPANYERHDYAHFMISQLRLDPSKVVEQTETLAKTAVWRAIRKDTLSTALDWVARRAKIDSIVLAGQPADRALVSSVLRQDPTLPDELRVEYTKHLLSFTLALRDWPPADIIPSLCTGYKDVAEAVFTQLKQTAEGDQALATFDLIEYWIQNVAEAPVLPWSPILYRAAVTHLNHLIASGKPQEAAQFLTRLASAPATLQVDKFGLQLVTQLQPAAHVSPEIAEALMILGAMHLPPGNFQQLLGDMPFVMKLPKPIQRIIAVLQLGSGANITTPIHPLASAAASIPEAFRSVVLIRLVEMVANLQRTELIDQPVLEGLLHLAGTGQAEQHQAVMGHLLEEFSRPERIRILPPAAWKTLPELYFAVGRYAEGIQLLEFFQREVFTNERFKMFVDFIGDIFLNTRLEADKLLLALTAFEGSQIQPEARVRSFCAALINKKWSVAMVDAARRMTTMIFNDEHLLEMIGKEQGLRLLEFHASRKDALDALRVSTALTNLAGKLGNDGPPLLVKMWGFVAWQDEVKSAALELLRRYIRQIPQDRARGLPAYFGQHLGMEIGEALQTTRALGIILSNQDLPHYAEALQIATTFFTDIATTYHETKDRPPQHRIRRDLESMPGNLSEEERARLAHDLLEINQLVFAMGSNAGRDIAKRKSDDKPVKRKTQTQEVILGTAPQTPVEFLEWLGGYFTKIDVTDLGLALESPTHIFGSRTLNGLYREVRAIHTLLTQLNLALPADRPTSQSPFTAKDLREEVASLWDAESLVQQRRYQSTLGEESQKLASLLQIMAAHTTDKIIGDNPQSRQLDTAKRQPENELEALRWISGYFARTHERRPGA
ncbi:MAG: hypothetical protein HY862_09480 [Chloroflexi bacterium]|nr:hypothetical protein [Chloroflexota bacterium]